MILGIREYFLYPFQAPNWLDLRVGAFLSITDESDDDLITGLSETIGSNHVVDGYQDRHFIGLRSQAAGPSWVFAGFTNVFDTNGKKGLQQLVTSDQGIGTTNANFWRPRNDEGGPSVDVACASILDSGPVRAYGGDGLQQHFPQNVAGAGGYAVMLGIQLLRDRVDSNILTMKIKSAIHSADMFYTNTPSDDLLHTTLSAWTPDVRQLGPVQLSRLPTALYFYWPFRNSRLRIHACGVLKAR